MAPGSSNKVSRLIISILPSSMYTQNVEFLHNNAFRRQHNRNIKIQNSNRQIIQSIREVKRPTMGRELEGERSRKKESSIISRERT